MPSFHIENELNLLFGYGDLITSTVYDRDTEEPIGLSIELYKSGSAIIGEPFKGDPEELIPLVFIQFNEIESLDVVIKQLNILRDMMVRYKNKA